MQLDVANRAAFTHQWDGELGVEAPTRASSSRAGDPMCLTLHIPDVHRPPIQDDTPLDPTRMAIGWICFLMFVGSISLAPFTFAGAP